MSRTQLPSVNVIVPVLNGEAVLGRCLDCLKTQTYRGRVLPVVIDDGSTDRTAEIARRFESVQLISQPNQGRAAARNNGIESSDAEVIAFTDSDCEPAPDWLERLIERLLEHDRRGVVGGAIALPSEANLWQRLDHQAWAHSTGPAAAAGPTLFGSTANMCITRSLFDEVGGFDRQLLGSEDSDLAFRVHRAGYQNFFEPAAIVVHNHPRTTLRGFVRQRFNYGKWTIQTVLKHKPLPPYSWMFPNNRLLLTMLWPAYSCLATSFTVKRGFSADPTVLPLAPLHFLGRMAEYLGTVQGCGEYQDKYGGPGPQRETGR